MLNAPKNTLNPLPDAMSLLKADHHEVDSMLAEYEEASDGRTEVAIVRRICTALTAHTQIEEKVFYPEVKMHKDLADLVDEAVVEHAGAKSLIKALEHGKFSDELYEARVTVLREYVRHHVNEEETETFPKVQATDMDLTALGEKLSAAKDRALQAA